MNKETQTFQQWICAMSEWLDQRDIASCFGELTQAYHAGADVQDAAAALQQVTD